MAGEDVLGQSKGTIGGELFSTDRKKVYGNDGELDPRGQSTFGGRAATRDDSGAYSDSSAQTAAKGYTNQANQAWASPNQSINYGNADQNFGNAMESRNLAYGARGQQQDAIGLARSAAYGNQPSQAEILGRQQTQQGLNAQLAGAASSKGGPLATMTAQRNAANNAAAYTQTANQGIAALRADEMAKARGEYAGQAGAIRSGDLGQGAQDLQAAGQHAQMSQAEASYQQEQNKLKAQREGMYAGLGYGVSEGEANRGVQLSGQEAERHIASQDINQQSKRDAQGFVGNLIGGLGGFAGGLFKAKGGPAEEGTPYLVGEKGPELIVPRKDGYVMTADETANILADAQAQTHQRMMGGMVQGFGGNRGGAGSGMMGKGVPDFGGQSMQIKTPGHSDPGVFGPGRAAGGPVDAGGARDLTDSYFGTPQAPTPQAAPTWGVAAPPDPYAVDEADVSQISAGYNPYNIVREDPYRAEDPYWKTQEMLSDRQMQYGQTPNTPGQPTTGVPSWLADQGKVSEPEKLNAQDRAAIGEKTIDETAKPAAQKTKGGEKASKMPKDNFGKAGFALAKGLKTLAGREEGGPVDGKKEVITEVKVAEDSPKNVKAEQVEENGPMRWDQAAVQTLAGVAHGPAAAATQLANLWANSPNRREEKRAPRQPVSDTQHLEANKPIVVAKKDPKATREEGGPVRGMKSFTRDKPWEQERVKKDAEHRLRRGKAGEVIIPPVSAEERACGGNVKGLRYGKG